MPMLLVMGMPVATTMGTKIICHRRAHAICHGHARGLFHGNEKNTFLSCPMALPIAIVTGKQEYTYGVLTALSLGILHRNSQIYQSVGNICTSDRLWTTEDNSCPNYKTINNSMVALNNSIQR